MQIRPVEIVCTSWAANDLNKNADETIKILMDIPSPPAWTTLSFKEASNPENLIKNYFGEDPGLWP